MNGRKFSIADLLVPEELAEKAKESGFQDYCIANYYVFGSGRLNENGRYGETEPYLFIEGVNPDTNLDVHDTETELHKFAYHLLEVPMYQQLIDWFRETHKIKIDIGHSDAVGTNRVALWRWNYDNVVGKWERIGIIQSYENYYDAVRVGIEKAFELL